MLAKLLRQRLAHIVSFGFNIIDEDVAFKPANFSSHNGKCIGFFTRRPNEDLIFVLLVRQNPDTEISRLVVYYVNTGFTSIQDSERDLLLKRLPKGIRISVVNIKTTVPSFSYPSFLMIVVEGTIAKRILDDYRPCYSVRNSGGSPFVVSNPGFCPKCDISTLNPEARRVWDAMSNFGLKIASFNCHSPSSIPKDFHILKIMSKGHLIYGIHFPARQLLVLLLPHRSQFGSMQEAETLVGQLKQHSKAGWKYVEPMRYYTNPGVYCNDSEILKACIVALFQPFISLSIIDVMTLMPDSDIQQSVVACSQSDPPSRPTSQIQIRDDEDDTIIDVVGTSPSVVCGFSQETTSSSSRLSTRSNICRSNLDLYQAEILAEIKRMDVCSDLKIMVSNYNYPLKNEVMPRHDPFGTMLDDPAFFLEELQWIAYLFNAHTTAVVPAVFTPEMLNDVVSSNNEEPTRFFVIPFLDEDFNAIVIVDRHNEEWGYINPNNDASRSNDVFNEIESAASKSCKLIADYVGMPITITSQFHKEYPKIHLLMAVFHLAKLFRYATMLPRKIIYRETDFRGFCDRLILELRIANMNHNFENGHIRMDGYITEDGYISPSSSGIQFERSVVPLDQCCFCKKRGYNILVNHIVMAHGGYGTKNVKRRWG